MHELYKIMEEIESEYLMCRCQNNEVCDYTESIGCCYDRAIRKISDIIRNHMNNDWVPAEKQIPKEPDYEGDGCDEYGNIIYDTWICPNCGERYEVDYDDYDFCPKCGQRLKRENNDD